MVLRRPPDVLRWAIRAVVRHPLGLAVEGWLVAGKTARVIPPLGHETVRRKGRFHHDIGRPGVSQDVARGRSIERRSSLRWTVHGPHGLFVGPRFACNRRIQTGIMRIIRAGQGVL